METQQPQQQGHNMGDATEDRTMDTLTRSDSNSSTSTSSSSTSSTSSTFTVPCQTPTIDETNDTTIIIDQQQQQGNTENDNDNENEFSNNNNKTENNNDKKEKDEKQIESFQVGDHVYQWCKIIGIPAFQHHGIVMGVMFNEMDQEWYLSISDFSNIGLYEEEEQEPKVQGEGTSILSQQQQQQGQGDDHPNNNNNNNNNNNLPTDNTRGGGSSGSLFSNSFGSNPFHSMIPRPLQPQQVAQQQQQQVVVPQHDHENENENENQNENNINNENNNNNNNDIADDNNNLQPNRNIHGNTSISHSAASASGGQPGGWRSYTSLASKWHKVKYNVSWWEKHTSASGTCTTADCDITSVVKGRVYFLQQHWKTLLDMPYHWLYANCECVAVWCKTGTWCTLQALTLLASMSVSQMKSTAVLTSAAAAATTTVTVTAPAAGFWGWLGFTTTTTAQVSLLTAQPWLIPVLATYGIASIGIPAFMITKAQQQWKETTKKLNDTFWDYAAIHQQDVFVECIHYYYFNNNNNNKDNNENEDTNNKHHNDDYQQQEQKQEQNLKEESHSCHAAMEQEAF